MIAVTLFDTSIATNNLGDEIIMDAVERIVREIVPDAYLFRVPTHDVISSASWKLVASSRLGVVGGTNLLKSRMNHRPLWRLRLPDAFNLRGLVLLGVGYQGYDEEMPSAYTRWLLRRILHPGAVHSLRDAYTQRKLAPLGLRAVNTSCPTLWELDEARCAKVAAVRARAAVALLTHYNPRPESDRGMIELLLRSYDKVHFWPQQFEDRAYLDSLGNFGLRMIPPSVADFTALLDAEPVDVVGSRLHGGIRALQRGRRAQIMTIDNRAREIARDTGLPVLERDDLEGLARWIENPAPLKLELPKAAIAEWRESFVRHAKAA